MTLCIISPVWISSLTHLCRNWRVHHCSSYTYCPYPWSQWSAGKKSCLQQHKAALLNPHFRMLLKFCMFLYWICACLVRYMSSPKAASVSTTTNRKVFQGSASVYRQGYVLQTKAPRPPLWSATLLWVTKWEWVYASCTCHGLSVSPRMLATSAQGVPWFQVIRGNE